MFLDTETIGTLDNMESVFPFDISIKIYDTDTEQVIKERCFLVRKFFNNKYVMMSSFSSTKYPEYEQKLQEDTRYSLNSVKEISEEIYKIINRYNIQVVVAHNGNFDLVALERLFSEFGIYNPFRKLDLLDTMEISKIITFSNDYRNFCIRHQELQNRNKESKFITNSRRVRTTAESIYCYLVDNANYSEEHTGLEDIDIEIYIYNVSYHLLGNKMITLNTKPEWKDYTTV